MTQVVMRELKTGSLGHAERSPGGRDARHAALSHPVTAASAVTGDYPGERPYRFTGGIIRRVAFDVSGQPYLDLERQAAAMLARE
jgi:arylsulfatase